ncbi:hypothetical protein WMF30_22280 [Sorangium sp. So ce134]
MNSPTDITIIGADQALTKRIENTSLYRVHFRLSERPDSEWSSLFSEQRKFPRHSMWRDAYVSGNNIVVECTLEEVERHLKDIKEDVAATNGRHAELRHKEAQRAARLQQQKQAESEEVANALKKLKF